MWYARVGSTATKHWHECLHLPLPTWTNSPGVVGYEPSLHHLPQLAKDKARLAFPTGDLVLLGVYYTKDNDQ